MKKTITKFLSFLLVLAMTLTGCGSGDKDALIGKWVGEVDLTDTFNTALTAKLQPDMREYIRLSGLRATLCLTFREDDTYTLTVDGDKLYDALCLAQEEVCSGMEAYFRASLSQGGVDSTLEAVSAAVAEAMEGAMEEAMTPEMLRELAEAMCRNVDTSGSFSAEEGRLYMTDNAAVDVDGTMYDDYSLKDGTLTLTAANSSSAVLPNLYPMTFTKAS